MQSYPNSCRITRFFPLAQSETVADLLSSSPALELYLAEIHELTVEEVRETFLIAGISIDVVEARAA